MIRVTEIRTMNRVSIPVVVALTFTAALAVNLHLLFDLPGDHLISSLYLLPVLIACHRLPARQVAAASAVAVALYLASAWLAGAPLAVWLFTVLGLAVGGYLATRFAVQRSEVARRVREAEEARERLQTFLGMVAHDLATGMTNVMVGAELLTEHGTAPMSDPQRVAAAAISGGTRQMQRLLDDLRAASAIGAGRFDVRPAPMDLIAVAREVVAQQQMTTNQHRLELDAAGRIEGVWDRERVAQLLTNLVSNAIKYSPGGGDVRVVVRPGKDGPIVCVQDQGIGIGAEERELLFQPFSRGGRSAVAHGSGLGLWIAQVIVEAHNGRIWVESEIGRGSVFSVALPGGDGMVDGLRGEVLTESWKAAGERPKYGQPRLKRRSPAAWPAPAAGTFAPDNAVVRAR